MIVPREIRKRCYEIVLDVYIQNQESVLEKPNYELISRGCYWKESVSMHTVKPYHGLCANLASCLVSMVPGYYETMVRPLEEIFPELAKYNPEMKTQDWYWFDSNVERINALREILKLI